MAEEPRSPLPPSRPLSPVREEFWEVTLWTALLSREEEEELSVEGLEPNRFLPKNSRASTTMMSSGDRPAFLDVRLFPLPDEDEVPEGFGDTGGTTVEDVLGRCEFMECGFAWGRLEFWAGWEVPETCCAGRCADWEVPNAPTPGRTLPWEALWLPEAGLVF